MLEKYIHNLTISYHFIPTILVQNFCLSSDYGNSLLTSILLPLLVPLTICSQMVARVILLNVSKLCHSSAQNSPSGAHFI